MILVTGASGLLGANFLAAAGDQDERTIAVSREHGLALPKVEHVFADLAVPAKVREIVESFKPAWIVHCAALTNVDWCEAHPHETNQVNVEMSRHLALAASRVGAGIVYISTDSVFDGQSGDYDERSPTAPLNNYAKSKLAGEAAVREACDQSLIVRTNIYGWNMQPKLSLAEWGLGRLEAGEQVPGFDDVVFTPILVNDLSDIILEMMRRGLRGLFNVAGSQSCSKYEFAVQLAQVFDLDSQLVLRESVKNSELRAPRPRITSLRTSRISETLGRPMPDLQSGLRRFRSLRASGFVTRLKGGSRVDHGGN